MSGASSTAGDNKAEIEHSDTWTVMRCKSFLASLRLLVAPRESFLTGVGPAPRRIVDRHIGSAGQIYWTKVSEAISPDQHHRLVEREPAA